LITGAAGHLGNVLARELVNRGERVKVLILPGENTSALDGLPVERFDGNVLQPDSLLQACAGVTTVFHLAGLVSLSDEHAAILEKVNVDGTRNMLAAAHKQGVKKFIYTSSIHALTRPPEGCAVDELLPFDPLNPAGAYDRTKAAASLVVLAAAGIGMETVIVCPTGVIGPYDYRRSEMGEMVLDWMHIPTAWLVRGAFDFVDVRDVADGHILARDQGCSGETYILGGERILVGRLCALVKSAVGSKLRTVEIPHRLALFAARAAEWYYRVSRTRPRFTRYTIETLLSNSAISSQKAAKELGYRPRSLVVSIADTVAWWNEFRKVAHSSVRV
jgi:dihydroflavonol-4-reductase